MYCHNDAVFSVVPKIKRMHVFVLLSLLVLSSCGKDSSTGPDGRPDSTPSPAPAPTPARITITPSSVSLSGIGETARLSATVYGTDNSVLSGAELSWTSSNVAVATVDNGGLVTAVSYGVAQITVRSGSASQSVQVTVIQEASRIVIEPAGATLVSLGQTVQMTAAVFDKNDQPVKDAELAWQSSNEGVAAIDDEGLVTAVSNGTALLSARSGSVAQTVQLTVMQEAGRIVIEPAVLTLFRIGFGERAPRKTAQLSATVQDANGHEIEDAAVKWSSDNVGIVTVDDGGLATATGDGTAEITARSGDASASVTVRCLMPVIVESSSPLDRSLGIPILRLNEEGQTAQLSAIVYDENGQVLEGAEVAWDLIEETCFDCIGRNVATADENGLVTARSNGRAMVMATASDFHWSNFALVRVYVDIVPSGGGHIAINPTLLHLDVGMMVRLSATEYDEDGQEVENAEFAWSSDDETVATVDDGLVTAESYGVAQITAQTDALSASITLTVSMDSDRARLVEFYHETDGENWRDSSFNNWLSTAPLADWAGVGIDEQGRVVSLLRGTQNLSGPIPLVLAELGELRLLQLFRNALTGSIPPELGQLVHLEELNLGTNQLTGVIPPELGQLVNLKYLDLWQNRLSGSVPPELGRLVDLELLDLSRNADLSGPLPEEMLNLTKLNALLIGSTQLCVPETARFDEWLAGIRVKLGVSRCGTP